MNYVPCKSCQYALTNVPNYDWEKYPCPKCNNTRQVEDPKEILCNLCGESMCPPSGTMNEQYPHGLYKTKVTGGYDSEHLLDMTRYTFSFCEKCLRKLFVECKVKPQIEYVNFKDEVMETVSWEEDQNSYEYRIWYHNGGHHQAYLDRKCNFVKDCPNKAVYTHLISDEFTEQCCCEEHKDLRQNIINGRLTKFISNSLKVFL
jgi:hypothetical protein